ncbi:hypothetical protein JCM8202_005573 [Rhodotorula sphaerocarpa]
MAQAVEERVVTLQSSLQQVKELLDTGIGCIAYLRGLLPEESFSECKLVAPRPPGYSRTKSSQSDKGGAKSVSDQDYTSVRVKKLKRGSSIEADKLLDYLELGASEAIEKGFLHKLVFAIYLDPDEPTNLVESYTFTFTYEVDAEGNKQPDLIVAEQFSSMDLSASDYHFLPRNKPRKMSDIKRQVQQMVKNLITSTQVLDELPRRRFLNIRLFYTDDTPAAYEPPCFFPVPIDAPGYTLTTPSVNEEPDFGTLGSIDTGFHGVALHSMSIAHILDVAFDENVSLEEALVRNKRDAQTRPVIWDAELLAQSVTDEDLAVVTAVPVGVKDVSGRFLPMQTILEAEDEGIEKVRKRIGVVPNPEAVFVPQGRLEETLVDSHMSDNEALRRAIAATEKRPASASVPATQVEPVVSRVRSYQPPAEDSQRIGDPLRQADAGVVAAEQEGRSSEAEAAEETAVNKAAAVEPETQLIDYSQLSLQAKHVAPKEPRGSVQPHCGNLAKRKTTADVPQSTKPPMPTRRSSRARASFSADACECGDKEDDGGMICCSTCEVWKHAVCYGFEDAKDSRIPDVFVCYHCRAQQGLNESTLQAERQAEIGQALAELRSLTLFRRAIDAVWHNGVLSVKELAKYLAVDSATAGQVLKRLKSESFVVEQVPTRKGKSKGSSQLGSLKAAPLVVNKTSKQVKHKKLEYFSPGGGAERGLLALLEAAETDEAGAAALLVGTASGGPALAGKKDIHARREVTMPDPIVDEESPAASARGLAETATGGANGGAAEPASEGARPGEQASLPSAHHGGLGNPDGDPGPRSQAQSDSLDPEAGPATRAASGNAKKRSPTPEADSLSSAAALAATGFPKRKKQKCSEAMEVEV